MDRVDLDEVYLKLKDKKLVVLCGGDSAERDVSLRSGEAVYEALSKNANINVELMRVVSSYDCIKELYFIKESLGCVFIALHGGWGENGKLQSFLDMINVPYTGSGFEACCICMDKVLTKSVLLMNNILVPDFFVVNDLEVLDNEDCLNFVESVLNRGNEVVVKPSTEGSTVGVSVISDFAKLKTSVLEAMSYSKKVLLEEYIKGYEVTVTVVGNEDIICFPPIEIVPQSKIYDYHTKYTPGKADYLIPPQSPIFKGKVMQDVYEVAKRSYVATGCKGYARVDMRVDEIGNVYVLELNTAPGMTSTSLVPKSALSYGWSFDYFLLYLVGLAFLRFK